jgi:excisionase family DNA binding protein
MAMTDDREMLWTIDQVAAYLGVPKQTIYAWRTRNYGPRGRRVGRYVRYRAGDVYDWFARPEDEDE